jgi:uncharacterized protein
MGRAYNVIDSDGHILEPLNLWETYIDPPFRDRAPRLFIDEDGKERLRIDGKAFGGRRGLGTLGAIGARDGVVCDDTMTYNQGRKGGFDPHARIPDMDADGIDAAFLYPSIGLSFGGVEDPQLVHALYHAYNRWLADYCKPYPDRLFGVAMLPLHSVELTIQEMRFARKELGMRAGFIRPNPYNNKMVHHPDYEPFWNAAEELDMAIGFHEGSSLNMPTVGVDRFDGRGAQHIISHTMEMMLACMSVIWGGVCERQGFNDSGLKTRPSELFQRNCWISFEPVEGSIKVLADYIGPHKVLWATDYPHPDGFFPGAPRMMLDRLEGVSPETKHGVMAGGATGFYGLN